MASLLDNHPDLIGIYVAGAGTTGIIDVLKKKNRARDIVVVAHELNGPTRAALLDGTIDAVISQDAGHEARSAFSSRPMSASPLSFNKIRLNTGLLMAFDLFCLNLFRAKKTRVAPGFYWLWN